LTRKGLKPFTQKTEPVEICPYSRSVVWNGLHRTCYYIRQEFCVLPSISLLVGCLVLLWYLAGLLYSNK